MYIAWTVVFVTLNIIPGDPVNLMLGGRPASDEVRENVRKNLGLDKPVIKSHGSTDSIGFANSLKVSEQIIKGNLIDKIKKNII